MDVVNHVEYNRFGAAVDLLKKNPRLPSTLF